MNNINYLFYIVYITHKKSLNCSLNFFYQLFHMVTIKLILQGIVNYKMPITLSTITIIYLLFLQKFNIFKLNNFSNRKRKIKLINLNLFFIFSFSIIFLLILFSIIFNEINELEASFYNSLFLFFIIIYLIILHYTKFFSNISEKKAENINMFFIFIIVLFFFLLYILWLRRC